ncbi:hypothetical protein DB346_21240 [Verrucomicrobia bacterium LW23]|nr:hypothetical protein DB346_21240 [Verrucomicrobia bacterium LW23]
MKRFAVLLVPEFRLQAVLRHSPLRPGVAAALVDRQERKAVVAECNAAARAAGVSAGLVQTQAMARCPNLLVLSGNPVHERLAQEALMHAGEAFSPFVESTAPGVVTVELPPEREWREADFMESAVRPLLSVGLGVCIGVAATPDLAAVAARNPRPGSLPPAGYRVTLIEDADAFLAPLPVAKLQPGLELLAVLDLWGIRTIGQLRALPREEACQRLGPEAVRLWKLAEGGEVRPLKLVRPRELFAEKEELEYAVETLEALLFLLRRLLEKIAGRLAAAWMVAGRMRLVLHFDQGPCYRHVFTIPEPTCDTELLFRMLHTHLEGFTSDSPIAGLELEAQPLPPLDKQGDLLDRSVRNPQQLAETLARLEALLGPDRVGIPEFLPSANPDAFRMRPFLGAGAERQERAAPIKAAHLPGAAGDSHAAPIPTGMPYLCFRPPPAAHVALEKGRPAHLHSSEAQGAVRSARGPWLLEGNWWDATHWSREEWDVELDNGAMYRLVRLKTGWVLGGAYSFHRERSGLPPQSMSPSIST